MRSKLKLSLIAKNATRKTTFKKRKGGIMKKLDELTTLCDVKACAVICSPYETTPVVWPSREGVQEVVSKFMELPMEDRFKYMMNQESYLRNVITKEEQQVRRLRTENRESQLRQFMFDCLEGKMNQYSYDARDLQDLTSYIGRYINKLDSRMKVLTEDTGESSSSFPLLHASSVAGADSPAVEVAVGHPVIADTSMVTAPNGSYGYFPYTDMNMNLYQHESSVQYHTPMNFNDQVQHRFYDMNLHQEMSLDPVQYTDMNMNMNQHVSSVQYHTPMNFNDQIQHRFYDMNLHQQMSLDPVQYPYQQGSFMNVLVEHSQQMGYDGEHSHFPFVNGNYHQLPTIDLATTGHMPSITTNTIAGVYAPDDDIRFLI